MGTHAALAEYCLAVQDLDKEDSLSEKGRAPAQRRDNQAVEVRCVCSLLKCACGQRLRRVVRFPGVFGLLLLRDVASKGTATFLFVQLPATTPLASEAALLDDDCRTGQCCYSSGGRSGIHGGL